MRCLFCVKSFLVLFGLSISPMSAQVGPADVPTRSANRPPTENIEFQSPLCFKDLSEHELESQKIRLVVSVTTAAMKPYWDQESLWRQNFLKKNPTLETALKEFNQQQRGQSLRGIKLEGKTAQELHEELLDQGFAFFRKPIQTKIEGKKEFWKLDGSTTENPRDPDTVVQIIYVHPDGSMIRLKPAGIPDKKGIYPRRFPHAIKAVLLKFNRAKCRGQRCNYDTTFANEAFKVNRFNQPIPKSPRADAGLDLDNFELLKTNQHLIEYVKDAVMELAHVNLKSACDHPLREDKQLHDNLRDSQLQ